jgi:hypothetical protein
LLLARHRLGSNQADLVGVCHPVPQVESWFS